MHRIYFASFCRRALKKEDIYRKKNWIYLQSVLAASENFSLYFSWSWTTRLSTSSRFTFSLRCRNGAYKLILFKLTNTPCCNNKPAKVFYPAIDHFVNKTAQSPPIHSIGIPVVSNHFGCLKGKFRIKYPPSETHISNSPDTPRDWLVVFEFNGKTKVRNSAMSFSEKYTHSYKK